MARVMTRDHVRQQQAKLAVEAQLAAEKAERKAAKEAAKEAKEAIEQSGSAGRGRGGNGTRQVLYCEGIRMLPRLLEL